MVQKLIEEMAPIAVPAEDNHDLSGFVLYHADWCAPCAKLKPHISKYINFTMDLTDANLTEIKSIPTVRAYFRGHCIGEIVGPKTQQDVANFYTDHIDWLMSAMEEEYEDDLDNLDIKLD